MALSPDRQKRLFYGVLAVVGGAVWFQYFLVPQRKVWGTVHPQLAQLRRQVQRTRADLERLPSLEIERARLAQGYALPEQAQRPQERLPELLDEVTQVARGTGVRLVVLRPAVEMDRLSPGVSGYLEVPLSVKALAGYHPLGYFIDALERSGHLFRIERMEVKPAVDDLWSHQADISLLAYLVPGSEG